MNIFVYGTLRKGNPLHYHIAQCPQVSDLATIDGYELYDAHGLPVVIRGKGIVFGEIYNVDKYTLSLLDMIEGGYHKEPVTVTSYGEKIRAKIYMMNDADPFKMYTRVYGGDWNKHLFKRGKKYKGARFI